MAKGGLPARERYWTRRELTVQLRATRHDGGDLGLLVGVGVRGATLLHKVSLGGARSLTITVELPPPLEAHSPLVLEAEVRWTHPTPEDPTLSLSGLEFVAMTPEAIQVLGMVFDKFTRAG
ncbi:MAG: hypothetical protein HY903_18915 [Deltaproteobacteria bacterium]|nr:hypothetical protein [Deltaproteobacteria bacterium]